MSDRFEKAKERLVTDYADAALPEGIEGLVLAEFDRVKRAKRRRWVVQSGAVAAAVVVVASVTWRPAVVDPVEAPAQEQPFVAIPYVAPLAPYERAEVVRMTLPVSALMAAGLQMRVTDPGAQVEADVLVGQDGRARALRLVEGN